MCGCRSTSHTLLKSASSVSPGYTDLCQAHGGNIQACHPASAPLRALLCVVEVRGITATTNICSAKQLVRQSQWRQNRGHKQIKHGLFEYECLSSGCFRCRIMTLVLLIFKAEVNFSLLLPTLNCAPNLRLKSTQRPVNVRDNALYMNISMQVLCL